MARAQLNAINVSLAQETEKFPNLWDCTLESYKRADLKPALWHKVAENVNERHHSTVFDADTAKKRFKDLKENFFKNYRKVRDCRQKCSGNGTDDMYQPSWPVYKHLLYLIRTAAQAVSTSNIKETTPNETSSVNVYFDCNDQQFHMIPDDPEVHQPSLDSNGSVATVLVVPQGPSSAPAGTTSESFASTPLSDSSGSSSCSSLNLSNPPLKRPAETDTFFNKKGESKKAQAGFLHEAVKVLSKIAAEPPPTPAQLPPASLENSLDGIVIFISQRLKDMTKESRKACENDLLDVMRKY